MEPGDAGLIRNALDKAGLKILTGRQCQEGIISDKSGVTGVSLDDELRMSCQMVCIGKGVNPNIDFLSGSSISTDKGIIVDKYTACNNPDIFAAGDVAVTFDSMTGDRIMTALWTNAVEMGKCAGYNITGTFSHLNRVGPKGGHYSVSCHRIEGYCYITGSKAMRVITSRIFVNNDTLVY